MNAQQVFEKINPLNGFNKRLISELQKAISSEESVYAGVNSDYGFPELCFLSESEVKDHCRAMIEGQYDDNDEPLDLDATIAETIANGMIEIDGEVQALIFKSWNES